MVAMAERRFKLSRELMEIEEKHQRMMHEQEEIMHGQEEMTKEGEAEIVPQKKENHKLHLSRTEEFDRCEKWLKEAAR